MVITVGLVGRAVGALVLLGVGRFLYQLQKHRRGVRAMAREYDIPMLPHSFILGHLIEIGKVMAKYPSDVNSQMVPYLMLREHPDLCRSGVLYLDVWPIAPPMLAVFHPDIMAQFCQDTSRPKHEMMQREFGDFTGCNDLVNLNGSEWKRWRAIFNPGFSQKNIQALVPEMIEEVRVFVRWLEDAARERKTVVLEPQAMKLTIDIISRVVLGERLYTQTRPSALYAALKRQVYWLIVDNRPSSLAKLYNPLRLPIMWNNNRIIKNAVLPHIQKQLAERDLKTGPKTINSLAIRAYVDGDPEAALRPSAISPDFLDQLLSHLKIFLFAGYDTTASTLSWSYYFLHNNPATLAALRAEHDAVLGPPESPGATAERIMANPALLGQLPYTTAVIRETLRLWPPVGSVRQGDKDFFLTEPGTGKRFPTDGWMLFSCSVAEQRNEAFWPRAGEFVPERWLAREGEELHVRKNGFRAFELGPRNCIGQELAQTELRIILAMTARYLTIVPAYDEAGTRVLGELGYQVDMPGEVTAHPKGGMPVTVEVRA